MKKIVSLFILSISVLVVMASCSKDDDQSPTVETIKKVQRVFAVNTNDGTQNEYRFQYNEDNTIKSIVKISNQISFTSLFEYEQNSMAAKITPSQGEVIDVKINYENSIITSFTIDDQELPIAYNATTETYEVIGSQLTLNETGDVVSLSGLVSLTYDETHKGAFYTIPSSTHQLIFLLFEETYLTTALSTKPVKSIDTGIDVLDFSNTYDNQGYIASAVSGSFSFEYHYFE